jgi:replicative DNA helicase
MQDKRQGLAQWIIGKHRNGPVGTVDLVFLAKYTRFESRTEEEVSFAEAEEL